MALIYKKSVKFQTPLHNILSQFRALVLGLFLPLQLPLALSLDNLSPFSVTDSVLCKAIKQLVIKIVELAAIAGFIKYFIDIFVSFSVFLFVL